MAAWDGFDEFAAVAAAGTFSGGAAVMGVSTSHMSRAVARLENRMQAQLFHRTTRSVRLTDAGRIFLDHCTRMIQERDEVIALMNEQDEPQGDLRVTCSNAMGERFVAPILRAFAIANPRLNVTLELTNRLVDLVAEGYDVAIRTGHLPDSRLIATRIASRTLYTCASPDYLAAHGTPVSLADLDRHQCLAGTSTTWHFTHRGRRSTHRPRGRWRCNSGAAVVDAALAGMGLCQLPEFYILPHLASGRLALVLEDHRADDEPIWAVYPQRRHMLPKITGLVEALRRELPQALQIA
ncbi:MAG: LysR family transcriptional regulator [Sphingobium phenoxybenzoativorans]